MSFRFSRFVKVITLVGFIISTVILPISPQDSKTYAQTAPSPTGRDPKLIWTPEQQAIWNRMRTENHPWYAKLKADAESGGNYFDNGINGVLMYQITGEQKYVDLAFKKIAWSYGQCGNPAREYFMEAVMFYDWLYPGLSDTQRSQALAGLNETARLCLTNPWNSAMPVSPNDSDQTTGVYFGLAFLYLATKDHNPAAITHFNHPSVGGLDATGSNFDTLRNAVKKYAAVLSEGGQWPEGTEYNMGTIKLLMMGAQGVRTADPITDHFPEATQTYKDLARGMMYEIAPNLVHTYDWGDAEHGNNNLGLGYRVSSLGMLAGLTKNDPTVGPYVAQMTEDFAIKYGHVGYSTAEPTMRIMYFYDPYAPKANWRTLPKNFYAKGGGFVLHHDGWTINDSFLAIHAGAPKSYVHHEVTYMGDFQLWRKNEWALTHPVDYAGPSFAGIGVNTLVFNGIPEVQEVKKQEGYETDQSNSYIYFAMRNSGNTYFSGYWNPPPTYLHEWTRSFIYLPSSDKKSDTIVVYDRTKADKVTNADRYNTVEKNQIENAPAVKAWYIHSLTQPTANANGIQWQTAGGQQVNVSTLLPANQTKTVVDEDALWPDVYPNPYKEDQKWHVRVSPTTEQQWDTFLNVVQAHDSTFTPNNTLVKSTDGTTAEGSLIKRADLNDSLVMFSANQSNRVLSSGYSASFSSTSSQTNLYLADLNPSKQWTISVDGAAAQALSTSENGLARLTVNGSGAHSISLAAQNTADISLTTAVDKTTASPGDIITYTITYTNRGDKPANTLKIVNPIPSGTTYVSGSASNGGNLVGSQVEWDIGTVAAGGTGAVSFRALVQ